MGWFLDFIPLSGCATSNAEQFKAAANAANAAYNTGLPAVKSVAFAAFAAAFKTAPRVPGRTTHKQQATTNINREDSRQPIPKTQKNHIFEIGSLLSHFYL
jgi:hypothetical protein